MEKTVSKPGSALILVTEIRILKTNLIIIGIHKCSHFKKGSITLSTIPLFLPTSSQTSWVVERLLSKLHSTDFTVNHPCQNSRETVVLSKRGTQRTDFLCSSLAITHEMSQTTLKCPSADRKIIMKNTTQYSNTRRGRQ